MKSLYTSPSASIVNIHNHLIDLINSTLHSHYPLLSSAVIFFGFSEPNVSLPAALILLYQSGQISEYKFIYRRVNYSLLTTGWSFHLSVGKTSPPGDSWYAPSSQFILLWTHIVNIDRCVQVFCIS